MSSDFSLTQLYTGCFKKNGYPILFLG